MRAGIPDRHVRRHTLTAYLNLGDLQRSLELPDLDDIYLLLVDRTGDVRWRGRGGYSEATLAALSVALQAVAARP